MSVDINVLLALASIAFVLEIALQRIKDIFPILGGVYKIKIAKAELKIAPMQFISLVCGIGVMFAFNAAGENFALFGCGVPAIECVAAGILVSGGSNFIHDIVSKVENRE